VSRYDATCSPFKFAPNFQGQANYFWFGTSRHAQQRSRFRSEVQKTRASNFRRDVLGRLSENHKAHVVRVDQQLLVHAFSYQFIADRFHRRPILRSFVVAEIVM
jgi:hypothetical protein